MTEQLAGQVAIVTGGGRGLGRAIAQALAMSGAAVTITARSTDQLEETAAAIAHAGGRVLTISADVTDQQAVDQVVATTERQLGPVTLLVNNAGEAVMGPLWEADPEQWWHSFETNVRGPFLASRAVLPGMFARRRGRIISLSSGVAGAAFPEFSAYGSSKAALLRLTDGLALETAAYGIQVFALNPGGVPSTAMGRQAREWAQALAQAGKYGLSAGTIPPAMTPDLAADACVFLASGRADALSGRVINAWEDLTDLVRRSDEICARDLYALRLRT